MRTLLIEPPETCMRDSSCTCASSHRGNPDIIGETPRPANLARDSFVTNRDHRHFAPREERPERRFRPPHEGAALGDGLRDRASSARPRIARDDNERRPILNGLASVLAEREDARAPRAEKEALDAPIHARDHVARQDGRIRDDLTPKGS
jgi:hypothetical protein